MALLGSVHTHLGPVELHHEDGRFETRGTYVDAIIGFERESVIVAFEADARWWYSHCETNGAVFAPFPEPILERTSS